MAPLDFSNDPKGHNLTTIAQVTESKISASRVETIWQLVLSAREVDWGLCISHSDTALDVQWKSAKWLEAECIEER